MATELVVRDEEAYLLHPTMNLALAKARLQEFQSFVKEYLVENEDFGNYTRNTKADVIEARRG